MYPKNIPGEFEFVFFKYINDGVILHILYLRFILSTYYIFLRQLLSYWIISPLYTGLPNYLLLLWAMQMLLPLEYIVIILKTLDSICLRHHHHCLGYTL